MTPSAAFWAGKSAKGGAAPWWKIFIIILLTSTAASTVAAEQAASSAEVADLKKKVAEQDKIIQELLVWKRQGEAAQSERMQLAAPKPVKLSNNAAALVDYERR